MYMVGISRGDEAVPTEGTRLIGSAVSTVPSYLRTFGFGLPRVRDSVYII